jgi:4-amino-4-deoxy-L-arabinose transferase-like glycosyltransferase
LNTPNPALVSERAARRLPRAALLLFCAAYLLPGLFGREPWKNADVTAFGYMMSIARGLSSPLEPLVAGLPSEGSLLPYWIGAAFIRLGTPWLDAPFAARVPFALLLAATIALLWYACYHLARTEAAQPVPFAFGGGALPVDYARAIADGSVLALIATLGLLQLGHETTPELAQLTGVALYLYAMAASPYRLWRARGAMWLGLPMLAASGAPTYAVLLGAAGVILCLRSAYGPARQFAGSVLVAAMLAAGMASMLDAWTWRAQPPASLLQMPRLLLWFLWPSWLLAAWTVWRWRHQILRRHISVPLVSALLAIACSAAMGGSDRALLLALPGLAVLAAFALPTLKRNVSAAIDWFAVFFFTGWALTFWVVFLSIHTGMPAKPAQNVARLLPGYEPSFSWIAVVAALAGSVAWVALVVWRTGRHRHPLWKSLVLPAGGVALNWLLAMSLMMPALDYARSYRPLVERVMRHIPPDACVEATALGVNQLAALEVHGPWRVYGAPAHAAGARCAYRIDSVVPGTAEAPALAGWQALAIERRVSDRQETLAIYRRSPS